MVLKAGGTALAALAVEADALERQKTAPLTRGFGGTSKDRIRGTIDK